MYKILTSSADTYITNKIVNNKFRATDANVGKAGTLDLFKLYDESTITGETSPTELSRILLKFDYTKISELVSDGKIDMNSNSFKTMLSLTDVYGGQTTPNNFRLIAMPLSKSFDEGNGRDIVNFADVDSSNFITSSYSSGVSNTWNQPGALSSGSLGTENIDVIISGSIESPSGTSTISLTSEQFFTTGKEDLELDVTKIISASVSGQIPNHGFVIAFSGSYENDAKTYFVKRFVSSDSSKMLSKPKILIKYDDSIIDNHSNFIFDVTGSLFLNNFHGETRKNILSGTSAAQISGADCMKLILKSGSYSSTHSVSQHKVGDIFQAGIYSASFAVSAFHSDLIEHVKLANSASFTQVWSSSDLSVGYLTSSMEIKSPFRSAYNGTAADRLIVSCKNLKDFYRASDEVKIRVFIEDRGETIIFTKSPIESKSSIYNKMYYRVIDVVTNKVVIPFDETHNSTRLSSDTDGMYYMFDMSSLEIGRSYKFEFLIKELETDVYVNDASSNFIVRK